MIKKKGICERCGTEGIVNLMPQRGRLFCDNCYGLCSICGEKKLLVIGAREKVCSNCYIQKGLGLCSHCGKKRMIWSNDLCKTCYNRQYKKKRQQEASSSF